MGLHEPLEGVLVTPSSGVEQRRLVHRRGVGHRAHSLWLDPRGGQN